MIAKVYALDDVPVELEAICRFINTTEGLELAGSSTDPMKGLTEIVELERVDLLYLDVEMPGLSGISVGKALQGKNIPIVLTTAHNTFAAEAFSINAVDYLLKPICYDSFLLSYYKVREYFRFHDPRYTGWDNDFIFVPESGQRKSLRVNLRELRVIEAKRNFTCLQREGKKDILTYATLNDYQEKLPESLFMRVHRSYIVNIACIESVKASEIEMDNGTTVPIGIRYHKDVYTRLGLWE